jgi:hypothetical protein
MISILKGLAILFGTSILGSIVGLVLYDFIVQPGDDPYGAGVLAYFICGVAIGAFCSLPLLARLARHARRPKAKG